MVILTYSYFKYRQTDKSSLKNQKCQNKDHQFTGASHVKDEFHSILQALALFFLMCSFNNLFDPDVISRRLPSSRDENQAELFDKRPVAPYREHLDKPQD